MTEKQRQAHIIASMKYNAKNIRRISLNLNLKTDAAIIDHLEKIENIQGYIKNLIKKDLTNQC